MIAKNTGKGSIVKAILLIFFSFFLLGIGVLSYITNQETKLANKIYPNVFLDNTHIGKLTREEAYEPYRRLNDRMKHIEITITYKKDSVATLSGSMLGIHSNAKEVIDRAYLIGRPPSTRSRLYQKISTLFNLTTFKFTSTLKYDKSKINELAGNWEEQYNKPAKNALFSFENGRVDSFRQEEPGLKIRTNKLSADIQKTVEELKTNTKKKTIIVLEEEIIEPETTLAEANDFGIEELIAEGKSDFTGSIPGRIHNVTLSASRFNGILIPKDKEISFNNIIGDISSLTGYQQAYVIKNGRTVLGDGGGVCQTSTTLFRTALNAGLPIIERTAHAYRVAYYENDSKPGLDATVYSPSVDLKIKNNTPASILIQTQIVGAELYFRFYGKKDGRQIEISPVTVSDVVPAPPPKYEDDPILKKGETKQVDFAAGGAKAKFHYKVSGASSDINFEKTFTSSYRPWQAVYLVGQAD